MVQLSLLLSAAALAIQSSVSACVIEKRQALSLYDAVAINPELARLAEADMIAEEQDEKKPSPKQKQMHGDLEDKAFKEFAKHIQPFHSITVIGDSYSSGDGALNNAGKGICRRNEGSFGFRLNNILKPESFQFIPCSGATVKDIQTRQVGSSDYGQPDLVVFTAGGDNGGSFISVLINCIVRPGEKKCDRALEHADNVGEALPASLAPLYQAIIGQPSTGRKREIIQLGYVQMYNRDNAVDQCPAHGGGKGSDVTWPSIGKGGYRDRINKTIVKINDKIRQAAMNNGVIFLDVDALFHGHRFCDGPDASWMQHRLSLSEDGIICHPTFEGHGAYIKAVLEYLMHGKGRTDAV